MRPATVWVRTVIDDVASVMRVDALPAGGGELLVGLLDEPSASDAGPFTRADHGVDRRELREQVSCVSPVAVVVALCSSPEPAGWRRRG